MICEDALKSKKNGKNLEKLAQWIDIQKKDGLWQTNEKNKSELRLVCCALRREKKMVGRFDKRY